MSLPEVFEKERPIKTIKAENNPITTKSIAVMTILI
jgi:hypothetical protein